MKYQLLFFLARIDELITRACKRYLLRKGLVVAYADDVDALVKEVKRLRRQNGTGFGDFGGPYPFPGAKR